MQEKLRLIYHVFKLFGYSIVHASELANCLTNKSSPFNCATAKIKDISDTLVWRAVGVIALKL